MSNGFFYEIHDDGKAPFWAFHFHGHVSSRPAVDLLHVDGRAQSWALHDHRQTTRQPSVAVQPLKKDVKKNVVIEQVPN